MTPAPDRRWFRFSLRELLMLTALAAAVILAYIETLKANQSKAEAATLQHEKAFLVTRIRTQEKLLSAIREIEEAARRPPLVLPANWKMPNHWLPPGDNLPDNSTPPAEPEPSH